jgi:hypothetical protein
MIRGDRVGDERRDSWVELLPHVAGKQKLGGDTGAALGGFTS